MRLIPIPCLVSLMLLLPAVLSAQGAIVLDNFDQGPDYAYQDFDKKVSHNLGVVRIQASRSKGGAGFNRQHDLSAYGSYVPVLYLKRGPNNKAKAVRLAISSPDKRVMFTYNLKEVSKDSFVAVRPDYSHPLDPTHLGKEAVLDLAAIHQLQIQGEWSNKALDIFIDKLELQPPDELARSDWQRFKDQEERKRQQAIRQEEERKARIAKILAEGIDHPADGPVVEAIYPVAPDTIAVRIQEGRMVFEGQKPYTGGEGFTIEENKKSIIPVWDNGRVVEQAKERRVKKDGKDYGFYIEPITGEGPMVFREYMVGAAITKETLSAPAAYRLKQKFAEEAKTLIPIAAHQKTKPTDKGELGGQPLRHIVYLQFAEPLVEEAMYELEFFGVNTKQASMSYIHAPRTAWSEAVHINHFGFRPADRFKRAFLSLWMGSGGNQTYKVDRFELLDADSGQSVYSGKIQDRFPLSQAEQLKVAKNHVQADVHYLDFGDFTTPGRYVVYVPGVGCSYPFRIAEDIWDTPWQQSMHGFLSHRSGIELGPPFTDYVRPRNMHPDDGFKIFKMVRTRIEGESDIVKRDLREQMGESLDVSKLKVHPDAWGGYMDAGDWDRRTQHLRATYMHLELLEMYPDYFESATLALPPSEANDHLPDILNEALFGIDHYRRLMEPDGGVRGGVESTSHPRPGEASWQETELLGTYGPDPASSLYYANNAAKASRLLVKYDAELAAVYRETAIRGWNWATGPKGQAVFGEAIERWVADNPSKAGKRDATLAKWKKEYDREHLLAAVELYHLTGEAAYHDAVKARTFSYGNEAEAEEILSAAFAYSLLPADLSDPTTLEQARSLILGQADAAIAFGDGNAFSLTCHIHGYPMMGYTQYYSAPEMGSSIVLPRAYYLTGDKKYYDAAIRAVQFSAGANPNNITYTTGVGHDYPRAALHIDSRMTGTTAPVGITMYGNSDPAAGYGFNSWVITWFLNDGKMVPEATTWPAAEWYVDLNKWPAMNEYTITQSLRPTSYYWGFLAAVR